MTPLEKKIVENFEDIKKKEYNSKFLEITESVRPILNTEHGVEVGSYMMGSILLSEELTPKNSLYVLNRLRVLRARRQNLLESVRYSLECIKLAKYIESDYDINRGKIGLAIIISSLKGYDVSNGILNEILQEKHNYPDVNQLKIMALLNLVENNIKMKNYTDVLKYLDTIVEKAKLEPENYRNSLMLIVESLYCQSYVHLNNEKLASKHLTNAEKFLKKRQKFNFIDEDLYYEISSSLYNLYFNIDEYSDEKTLNILKKVEKKSDFGFSEYCYEMLFEYYKKQNNFLKYEKLKKKYDKRVEYINELNYKMLSLYMIESIEEGIMRRDHNLLFNKIIKLSIFIMLLILGIGISLKKIFGLQRSSIKDFLTNLNNRKSFDSTLLKLQNKELFLLVFDIDNFKNINDTFGHAYGDTVLKKLGEILLIKEKRYSITAYRIGGEEFAVIFAKASSECQEVIRISEEIREEIENTSWDKSIKVTISGGLSYKCNQLYEESDKLLYMAKKTGKNKILNNISI